jgi:hypothetical protein
MIKELKVFIASWNVSGGAQIYDKDFEENLSKVFDKDVDMVVLGLQEFDVSPSAYFSEDAQK